MRPKREGSVPRGTLHGLARRTLFAFLLVFILARVDVFLIMAGKIPNGYLFLGAIHVHHLNYGIFLLSAVAGYSVFRRPKGGAAEVTALLYGAALALTFDEFGMWLHLGGSYWQRVSVDAVAVVAALIAFLAYGRTIKRLESRHLWAFLALALVLVLFVFTALLVGDKIGNLMGPKLEQLEAASSP
jgi:hypothetical protein